MKNFPRNMLVWALYSILLYFPLLLITGFTLKSIGIAIILGFFAGIFNDLRTK